MSEQDYTAPGDVAPEPDDEQRPVDETGDERNADEQNTDDGAPEDSGQADGE